MPTPAIRPYFRVTTRVLIVLPRFICLHLPEQARSRLSSCFRSATEVSARLGKQRPLALTLPLIINAWSISLVHEGGEAMKRPALARAIGTKAILAVVSLA